MVEVIDALITEFAMHRFLADLRIADPALLSLVTWNRIIPVGVESGIRWINSH